MASQILYLASGRDRAIFRVLGRKGHAWHAGDIKEAMFLMVERDFEYFFVDADTPQARAFILHLRHDPQLPPPKAVVLITGNDDEDCDSWGADTFITKARFADDVPYVFSHLKGEPSEAAGVIRIAPEANRTEVRGPGEPAPGRRLLSRVAPGEESRRERKGAGRTAGDKPGADPPVTGLAGQGGRSRSSGGGGGVSRVPFRAIAFMTLLAMLGVWLFTLGPLSSSPKPSGGKRETTRVEAETSRKTPGKSKTAKAEMVYPATEPEAEPPMESGSALPRELFPDPPSTASAGPAQPRGEPLVDAAKEQPPTAEPVRQVNSPPVAFISGPEQVTRGQTAEFTAGASDPDGDQVSLQWTTKTMCWSTPGLFSISVTATDARGATSTVSKSIRVI